MSTLSLVPQALPTLLFEKASVTGLEFVDELG